MIVVVGASGYVGQAMVRGLGRCGWVYSSLSRTEVDLYDPIALSRELRIRSATFLINCAGYTGKPNVDACEWHKSDCLLGNAVLPGRIREACQLAGLPWGHVSSGCIYTGARSHGQGFRESDPPNFCFRTNHCSFYSGTKALGEELLSHCDTCYVWRLRIPFNEVASPRNYLSKLLNYPRLLQATNSLSHLDDFVDACLRCWERRLPFGLYNVVNTGAITTREIVELLQRYLTPGRAYDFFNDEAEFMAVAAKTPRSNCILDNGKLRACGIAMRDVHEAVETAIRNWRDAA
jgi:dTDP-4-dehydrorhamnose reductase